MGKRFGKKRRHKTEGRQPKRNDRVGPTPETLAKLVPWRMNKLLEQGPENGGIDHNQFEAGVEIGETFHQITALVGHKPIDLARVGRTNGEPGERLSRAIKLYVEWGNGFARRFRVQPHVIVEIIENERPCESPRSVALLKSALNLWIDTKEKQRAEERAAKQSTVQLLTAETTYG